MGLPHLLEKIWCASSSEETCSSFSLHSLLFSSASIGNNTEGIKHVYTALTTLRKFFHYSPKRCQNLKEMEQVLTSPRLSKSLQTEELDLTLVSSLVDATLQSMDDVLHPAAQ